MSSRLPRDPHPRTTKKASASAAAVQLLLRRGGRAAAKDESIEFFSALRECEPDPRVSGQTGIGPTDRRGKARRSGGDGELLSTEIGKHDYDWLLTPPATPPCFPATSGAGATAALNRLTRATSASFAKSNSTLSQQARRESGNPTSRLATSSSATTHSSSVNTPAFASSYRRPSHVRTVSSASSSSINAASNASPSGSAATSPRTPATARSAASISSKSRPRSKAEGRKVASSSGAAAASQPKGPSSSSSNSGPSAPAIARQLRAPTTGASIPKSTRVASEIPAPLTTRRGANAVARSRFASQPSSSAMSTAQPAQNVVRSGIIKPRPVPAAVKQCRGKGTAAMSSTASTQSWLSSRSSAIAASLSTSRGDGLLANKRLSSSGDYGGKINVDKVTTATPRRPAGLAPVATSSGPMRTGSRKSANADAMRTVNEDVQQRSIHSSMASRSRPGLAATTSAAGSVTRGRRATNQKGKVAVDAFPSTRYDAMLLREDPKNLTWLNGCGDEDSVGLVGGAGALELEPFSVTMAETSGTTA